MVEHHFLFGSFHNVLFDRVLRDQTPLSMALAMIFLTANFSHVQNVIILITKILKAKLAAKKAFSKYSNPVACSICGEFTKNKKEAFLITKYVIIDH
ncbi:hypothetical protein BpHYR1_025609 [Brachionus plicatilis]|uniref:Uncharacterized protein n=1 Tax=Brachionus plicatilis TaxID=10195 RepID=A0A3M7SUG9_BRAPC|nr:hypothetical protein BpHYR1_025609 [Brachionus plicatilis]